MSLQFQNDPNYIYQNKIPISLMRLSFKEDICGSIDIISSMHKRLSGRVPVKAHRNQCSNGVLRRLHGGSDRRRVVPLNKKEIYDYQVYIQRTTVNMILNHFEKHEMKLHQPAFRSKTIQRGNKISTIYFTSPKLEF